MKEENKSHLPPHPTLPDNQPSSPTPSRSVIVEPEFDTESDSSRSPSESPSPSPSNSSSSSVVSPFSSPTPHAFPKAFTSLIDAERATKRLLTEMTRQHVTPLIPSSQQPVKKMKVAPQPDAWKMADIMNMSQATSALISIFSQASGSPSTSALLQNHHFSPSSISSFPPNSSSSSFFPSSTSSPSSPSSTFSSLLLRRNEKEKGKENEEVGLSFDINSPELLDLQLKAQQRLVSFPTRFHSCFQTQEQIEDINYWASICHQLELHIFNQVFIDQKLKELETTTLSASNIQEMRDSMMKEGYFHFSSSSSPSSPFASSLATSAEQLTKAVEELREQGWHPMWLLLFDEVRTSPSASSPISFLHLFPHSLLPTPLCFSFNKNSKSPSYSTLPLRSGFLPIK
jgi:hypothetical protein